MPASGGTLEGVLLERTSQLGALVGARFLHGRIWRFVAGADFGLARRSFSGINHYDVSDPAGAQSYGLTLGDTSQTAPILAPSAGFEWAGTTYPWLSFHGWSSSSGRRERGHSACR